MAELRILGQFGHFGVSGVSPLEYGLGGVVLLLALPEKILSERFGELGGKHVAAGGARRKSGRMNVGSGHYRPCGHLETAQE